MEVDGVQSSIASGPTLLQPNYGTRRWPTSTRLTSTDLYFFVGNKPLSILQQHRLRQDESNKPDAQSSARQCSPRPRDQGPPPRDGISHQPRANTAPGRPARFAVQRRYQVQLVWFPGRRHGSTTHEGLHAQAEALLLASAGILRPAIAWRIAWRIA